MHFESTAYALWNDIVRDVLLHNHDVTILMASQGGNRLPWQFKRKKWKGRHYAQRSVVTHVSLVQVLFWEEGLEQSEADRVRVINCTALLSGLKGSTLYLISVRAQNSAGLGPCSTPFNITTKKPRESTHKTGIYLL